MRPNPKLDKRVLDLVGDTPTAVQEIKKATSLDGKGSLSYHTLYAALGRLTAQGHIKQVVHNDHAAYQQVTPVPRKTLLQKIFRK